MEAFPSGAAARLLITPNALRRHARRAQRELAALGLSQNLAFSQEFVARVFGLKTWNEAVHLAQTATVAPSSPPTPGHALASPAPALPGREAFLWAEEPPVFDAEAFRRLMLQTAEQGFSDVSVSPNEPILGERFGRLYTLSRRRMTPAEIERMIVGLYDPEGTGTSAIHRLRQGHDLDFPLDIPQDRLRTLRARVNVTGISSNGVSGHQVTCRLMPHHPPRLEVLQLPEAVERALFGPHGLVVVAGSTGTGKSTFLGSVIRDYVENPRDEDLKILTYERPIEFVYDDLAPPGATHRTIVAQTEVGRHLPSFEAGIHNALRRKPHAIMVGECRDRDTVEALLEAARTGHMVYTALHANFVADVLRRMIRVFPGDEQDTRRTELLSVMRLIVVQKLVPSTDGKRVALREYLVLDDAFIDAALAQPERLNALVQARLDVHRTSFAHDAQAKFDAGVIDERTLRMVVREARSAG